MQYLVSVINNTSMAAISSAVARSSVLLITETRYCISDHLLKLRGGPEASHLLRPAAGHRDLSGPQPRRLLVGHVHDGEAAEVLLGLDERSVGEQRRAARRIDTEHRGSIVQAADEDE